MSRKFTIDLVSYDPKRDAHVLIAVEQGPWPLGQREDRMQRLQERLYDYIDAAIDGALASKYPESRGKSVIIRLDCYGIPRDEVEQFYFRFTEHVHAATEIQAAITQQGHIKDIDFEFTWHPLTNAAK